MKRLVLAVIILMVPAPGWAAKQPVPVSPGDLGTFAVVQAACPTFSWDAVASANAHELVIYRVNEEGQAETEPTVRVRLPGAVGSWTPSLEQCLERGQTYAWSVRAEGKRAEGEWSDATLFQVAPGPSIVEVEEALALLRQHVNVSGTDGVSGRVISGTTALSASKHTDETEGAAASSASPSGAALGGSTHALQAEGPISWECPPDMDQVGTWCIDKVAKTDPGDLGAAMEVCHNEEKAVCSLHALMTCDRMNIRNAEGLSCGWKTDTSGECTRAFFPHHDNADVVDWYNPWERYSIYAGSNKLIERLDIPGPGEFCDTPHGDHMHIFCCLPLSP